MSVCVCTCMCMQGSVQYVCITCHMSVSVCVVWVCGIGRFSGMMMFIHRHQHKHTRYTKTVDKQQQQVWTTPQHVVLSCSHHWPICWSPSLCQGLSSMWLGSSEMSDSLTASWYISDQELGYRPEGEAHREERGEGEREGERERDTCEWIRDKGQWYCVSHYRTRSRLTSRGRYVCFFSCPTWRQGRWG